MSDLSYILHLTSIVSWASAIRYTTGDIVLEWHISNFILTRKVHFLACLTQLSKRTHDVKTL